MTYKQALIFATRAHAGQKRLNGNNYIIHPIRVSQEVKTKRQKIIALLHDVVEDTKITTDDIKREFGTSIMLTVDRLTHRKDDSYEQYIQRLSHDPDAIAVKIADIADNLSDSPSEHAIEKSALALNTLLNV